MIDQIWQGTTWRRQVLIMDAADAPIDPTQLVACLCPETPITITQNGPGDYSVSLTEIETAALTATTTHWEMFGLIGTDVFPLVREAVKIESTCARLETP